MKSLGRLLELLLVETGSKCSVPIGRDVCTLRSRLKHEGDSFITITLPAFCSDFERSLAEGRLVPGGFLHFRKCNRTTGMPAFLSGFLYHVFERSGEILLQPSIDCIRAIRQICLFGKKVERRCSVERLSTAIEGYEKCDDDVVTSLPATFANTFRQVGRILVRSLAISGEDILDRMLPAHGPGATAEGVLGNAKWHFRGWHRRLSECGITFWRYVHPHGEIRADTTGLADPWPEVVEPEDEEPVKVVFVPKTQKTPRVIAVEPVCMQFAQQGIRKILEGAIERGPLTAGHVNFTDQSVNQDLALEASRSGDFATIDLSEASDRVSVAHVEALFGGAPDILRLLLATRSTRARLPDGRVIPLRKFASMGSALCFPVESMVFYTTIITSLVRSMGLPVRDDTIQALSREVWVFGDDIIVRANQAEAVCADLEAFGFKVNRRKSFWTGQFRESCGTDAFSGEPVTPCYLRDDAPKDCADASQLVSWIATANQLRSAGYFRVSSAIREVVERILGNLPEVPGTTAAIGFAWPGKAKPQQRYNRGLQRLEYRCWVPRVPKVSDGLDGSPALAKFFRVGGSSCKHKKLGFADASPVDEKHLERSARRYGLTLKRSWVLLS